MSPVHLLANELYNHNSQPAQAPREEGKRMFWLRPHSQGRVGVGWAGEGPEVTVQKQREWRKKPPHISYPPVMHKALWWVVCVDDPHLTDEETGAQRVNGFLLSHS